MQKEPASHLSGETETGLFTIAVNGLFRDCITDEQRPTFQFHKSAGLYVESMRVCVLDERTQALLWDYRSDVLQISLPYAGAPLQPFSPYRVSATLHCENDLQTSATAAFETAFLAEPWQARWIEPLQEPALREPIIAFHELFKPNPDFYDGAKRLRPGQALQRLFALPAPVKEARLYISAHGLYSFKINGRELTERCLTPETSSYESRLYYQCYDIGPALQEGPNELLVELSDGWWIGRIGISGDSCQYGDRLACIFEMHLTFQDGTQTKILSDTEVRSARSRVDFADLFIGERHDYTRPAAQWQNCLVIKDKTDPLLAQPIAPIVVHREHAARWFTSPKGELLADFAVCLAGIVELIVDAPLNTEVRLDFCETLDVEGNFFRNITGRNKNQSDSFKCAAGENHFRPRFTYHGFRYVRISGVSRSQVKLIKALAMGTELKERGHFQSSDARINQLQKNIRQSLRSNMFSVPTDCPQREKAGWTGDILGFAPTACFNFEMENFLSGWLANMRTEQFANGEIPVVVPNYPYQERQQAAMGGSGSAAWSDACVHIPWVLYQNYGNVQVLAENYAMMDKYLTFVEEACAAEPDGKTERSPAELRWNKYLWNKGFHFGDWLMPSFARLTHDAFVGAKATKEVTASCFHAYTLQVFLEIIHALMARGQGDAAALQVRKNAVMERLLLVKQAITEVYISEDGLVKGDYQGLYVMVLKAKIVQGKLREKVARRLARLIEENGTRLDTGFVSTPYLPEVLSEAGYHRLASALLFQSESPSWLYMVDRGATSIWENWEAIRPDGSITNSSYNHYALGSIGDWIYKYILGIRSQAAGYAEVLIAPDIHCGLREAEGHIDTAYGRIACAWRRDDKICRLNLEIPANIKASLQIGGKLRPLDPGKHSFSLEGEYGN